MAEAPSPSWERWTSRGDHTVVYEARPRASSPTGPGGYEFRRPGEAGEVLGVMDRETFETIYEREEVRDERG